MKKLLPLLIGLSFLIVNTQHIFATAFSQKKYEKIVVRSTNNKNTTERSGTYYIIYAELNTETASLVIPLPDDFGEASIRIVRCADEAVMQTCTADAAAGKVTLRVDYAPGSYRIELESDAYTGEGHFTLP